MYEPNRRRYAYCDIWDLVAPQVACPACSGEVAARWEQEATETSSPKQADQGSPSFLDLPTAEGDVRAEAELLLGLLAS